VILPSQRPDSDGTEIVKFERNVPALWPELRAAKAWISRTLMEHRNRPVSL
jgi:hypothetical protein